MAAVLAMATREIISINDDTFIYKGRAQVVAF